MLTCPPQRALGTMWLAQQQRSFGGDSSAQTDTGKIPFEDLCEYLCVLGEALSQDEVSSFFGKRMHQ